MNRKIILTSLVFIIHLTVNAQDWWGNRTKIKGNGNVITKTRTISSYDEIAVGGNFHIILKQGKGKNITIEAEDNIIPYIITKIENNSLQIKYKKHTNVKNTKRIIITVNYDKLQKISLGGAGNIINEGTLKSDDFKINLGGSGVVFVKIEANNIETSIGGSGNIRLLGKTNKLDCSISGSGSVKAYELVTNTLSANIAGSGSVRNTVSDKINVKIVGSGNVYYKGNPSNIKSKSVGSGNIIDKN